MKLLTGLLANKLKINATNIKHLYLTPRKFNEAVSRGFIEKTYVFGPNNFTPQYIEILWKLYKMTTEKSKNRKKINKESIVFSGIAKTLNYLQAPAFRKYEKLYLLYNGNNTKQIAHLSINREFSELKKYEKVKIKKGETKLSGVTNITIDPLFKKKEKVKVKKRNLIGWTHIEPNNENQKEKNISDLKDIYVRTRKR